MLADVRFTNLACQKKMFESAGKVSIVYTKLSHSNMLLQAF